MDRQIIFLSLDSDSYLSVGYGGCLRGGESGGGSRGGQESDWSLLESSGRVDRFKPFVNFAGARTQKRVFCPIEV